MLMIGRRIVTPVAFRVLLFAIVTRLALAFMNWYVLRLIPPPWEAQPRSILGWSQWDAAHYVRIAMNGYDHPTDPGNTAFFPLYPMIVKLAAVIPGQADTISGVRTTGVFVAVVFFLMSVVLVTRLFQVYGDDDVAQTAGILYAISPFSFFLTAGYTESLFMVLVAAAFLLGYRQRWIPAAVIVALVTATRVTGVFLIPVLLLMAWRKRESIRTLVTIAVISPLGIVAYMGYTWWLLGDPLAFLNAQDGWGGFQDRTGIYIEGFFDHPIHWFFGDDSSPIISLQVALLIVWLLSLVSMHRYVGVEMTLFSVMIIFQASTSFHSLGRYLLPALGTYVVIAVLLTRFRFSGIIRDVVIASSVVLMTALLLLFSQAEWIV